MEITVKTFGHACFMLESGGYRTVIDPYAPAMIPGCPELDLEAEAVFCSHGHGDHSNVDAVKLVNPEKEPPYTVDEYVTAHDDQNGSLRGMNTVRIFDFSGLRVAHLGDIGCFPGEELTQALKGVDCLLIPVGGFYTIGCQTAWQIIRQTAPRVTIPMHYRTDNLGLKNIGHIDDFVRLYSQVSFADNAFTLTSETEKQILVLNYKL